MIFIIVQTPNGGGTKFYDHTIVSNLLQRINKLKPKNKKFIIGCTVMPNYIDQIATELIPNCENCTISYNPEFIAQGDIVKGFKNPDIILVGTKDPEIRMYMNYIYNRMTNQSPQYHFMTPLEAEIVKISLNGFITTKISFANMISDLCDTLGANKKKVLEAIGADTRIGQKYFNPGLSFGGPCFPRDTKALKQLMDQNSIPSKILEATTEYNEEHNRRYAAYIAGEDHFLKKKALTEVKASIVNIDYIKIQEVCYKPGSKIPIIEESAKLKIAELLVKVHKKKVIIQDTEDIIAEVKKEYGTLFFYDTFP